MSCCIVSNCSMSLGKESIKQNITFHGFPTNANLKRKWEEAIGMENQHKIKQVMLEASTVVCSQHFTESCFDQAETALSLQANAVPSMFESKAKAKRKTKSLTSIPVTCERPKRMKIAKKVFDPSDVKSVLKHDIIKPTIVRIVPKPTLIVSSCDICQTQTPKNTLKCSKCQRNGHASCWGYDTECAKKLSETPWLCINCRPCAICNMDKSIGTIYSCDKCSHAFHSTCHIPPLTGEPSRPWKCLFCQPAGCKQLYDYLPSYLAYDGMGFDDPSSPDTEVPDASQWSVEQVVQWFNQVGLEEHSYIFTEQEIDGIALLLMTRDQILKDLHLKLGPAIKLYTKIRILQTRTLHPDL